MVSVCWYPRIKDLVANPYGGVVGVQNSRHDNLRKLPIGLVGRLRGVELCSSDSHVLQDGRSTPLAPKRMNVKLGEGGNERTFTIRSAVRIWPIRVLGLLATTSIASSHINSPSCVADANLPAAHRCGI
jgi:hypothetical protein